MSEVIAPAKKSKNSKKFDNLIGKTDPKVDAEAREVLISARVALLLKHSFFGNLATRLKLINADEWCSTAATDGRNLYYNSRFILKLRQKEVQFLLAHEILHVCYDHMGRRLDRDPKIWNIADDYAVNADLKRHKVGEFITSVPCLYEAKYDGKLAEEIYDDLMENVQKINIDTLVDMILDEHMDNDGENDEDGEGNNGDKKANGRPKPLSKEEQEQLRQEIKQNIIAAASGAEAGTLPAGIQRMVKKITEPQMNWRELIQSTLTSVIRTDYSFVKPNRRGWHMDAIMPGMTPGEEIDIAVAIDMSGSISDADAAVFLGEIRGIMESFTGYRIHVFSFDTEVYNPQDFTSDNLESIEEYEAKGGGGTHFDCIFSHLSDVGMDAKRLIVFTDGYTSSWGPHDYCDTTWILYGSNVVPPWGTWAYFKDQ